MTIDQTQLGCKIERLWVYLVLFGFVCGLSAGVIISLFCLTLSGRPGQ